MKLALVCLLAAQALSAPSSSEEDLDMRNSFSSEEDDMDMRNTLSSSEEEDIDMRNALSSSEEDDIDMRNFTLSSSEEEGLDMGNFTLSSSEEEEDLDMRAASCKCGIKGGANRIVGGVEAKVNEFPWIASLILIVSLMMMMIMMIIDHDDDSLRLTARRLTPCAGAP